MALNEVAKHFYEKEVERLLGLDDVKIIKEKFIDMQSQIDDLYVELGERARRIVELETELSVKEDLLKLKNALCEEEHKVKLPTMPIDVASMLINATVEFPTNSFQKALGAGETSFADKYSKSDLREIAKHLLVFCNDSDEDDDTQS